MKEIPEHVRVTILDGEAIAAFLASPGVNVVRKVLDDECKRLVLAMLTCKPDELLEWRGRLQAIFGVLDGLSGRVEAAEHLATRLRAEVEADRERERGDVDQESERGFRSTGQGALEREGTY